MKAPQMPNIKNYVSEDALIHPGPKAHFGLSVPEIMLTYGDNKKALQQRIPVIGSMVRCLTESKKSYASLKENPVQAKSQISEADLKEIEKMIYDFGGHNIGYTKVDRDMIYSNKAIMFPNAIVLTMEMQADKIETAPSKNCVKEIFRTYKDLGILVNRITQHLRNKGYAAQAGPALGGDVNYPLLAQKAGLGHCGRHGLLISPLVGSRQRIASVYTNIANLPYTDKTSHTWLEAFCESCNKCFRACPAKAIHENVLVFEDGTKQHVDYKKCAVPFSKDYGCTVCVKACTFSTTDYYKIKTAFEKNR